MSFSLNFQPYPNDGGFEYAYVPWDSELFGFSFFELRIEGCTPDQLAETLPDFLKTRAPHEKDCLVYTRILPTDVPRAIILAQSGFYPVETLLEIHMPLKRFEPLRTSDAYRLRHAEASDLPEVVRIARSAFKADRFHLDPHLPNEKADLRYARWVERAIGKDGEILFLFEEIETNRIIGFSHLREKPAGLVELSLVAVDPVFHGTGLGSFLDAAVLAECKRRGYWAATGHKSLNNRDVIVNPKKGTNFTHRNPQMTLHWFRSGT